MQNWESIPQANYDHNWYGTMFSSIKREHSTPAYSLDHHHIGLGKTTNMESNFGSPTSPNSHQTSDGLDGHGFCGLNASSHPLGFNPLTPPGYPNAVIPQINFNQELSYQESSVSSTVATAQSSQNMMNTKMEATQSLTPSHTPPMDITPPKSPKSLPATPEKDNEMSSNSNDSGEDTRFADSDNDDESISKPKFNSHGKVKKFKCKQCGYIAITKVDFWAHAREHIKPEKLLECHFCPFVTELKHHLEYHIRKHKNLKPFQCDQCSYSCVNKSMLNSHLKSHSKVYQYRCADCDYATKYCHSFKLHLRKYTHKPGMVLNEDGTPNPLIIIDVYGTRRGPKMKGREANASAKLVKQEIRNMNHSSQPASKTMDNMTNQTRIPPLMNNQPSNMVPNLLPSTLASMLQQSRNLPFFPYLNLNLQMLAAQQQAVLAQMSPNMGSDHALKEETVHDERTNRFDSGTEDTLDGTDHQNNNNNNNNNAMDLTQTSPIKPATSNSSTRLTSFDSGKSLHVNPQENHSTTPVLSTMKTSRRKGRAFKLDTVSNESDDDEEAVQQHPKLLLEDFNDDLAGNRQSASSNDHNDTLEKQRTHSTTPSPAEESSLKTTPKNTYECKSCGIYFRDAVLHTIHMGYHSCDDEFKCNMCGEKCGDRLTFFVHIARFPHS